MYSTIISIVALVVSIVVAWRTLLHRGNLRMTQPVLVGLLYERPGEPKVFFRALLYATGKRGHILESLYLKVKRGGLLQTFNYWMYGETTGLMIGSGLRIGDDGVSYNHHFVRTEDQTSFQFTPGEYTIDVYAKIVNRRSAILLKTVKLSLIEEHALALQQDTNNHIIFNQKGDADGYYAHILPPPASRDSKMTTLSGKNLLILDAFNPSE